MIFWDSSALVPLILKEEMTDKVLRFKKENPRLVLWWASPVEIASAVERAFFEKKISIKIREETHDRLSLLQAEAYQVSPTDLVRQRAIRLIATHHLKAADSLQLASALFVSKENPKGWVFVCLDKKLAIAAQNEGFKVNDFGVLD